MTGMSMKCWCTIPSPASIASFAELEGDALPGDEDLARVGLVEPVQDVHQRRLAGAVLAEERVHLARARGRTRRRRWRARPGTASRSRASRGRWACSRGRSGPVSGRGAWGTGRFPTSSGRRGTRGKPGFPRDRETESSGAHVRGILWLLGACGRNARGGLAPALRSRHVDVVYLMTSGGLDLAVDDLLLELQRAGDDRLRDCAG